MSASKILKIKDADGNLQRVSSTDETYLAWQAGKQLAASSGNSVGDLTMTGTPNRTVGSHVDTFYNEPVGTHPASQLSIGSTTSTLKQRTGSPSLVGAQYQPNGRDKYQQPITYDTLHGGKTGIHPMTTDEFDSLVDRLNSIIATNDYLGSYKLSATAPSSDYTERFTLGTDTRTDGTSIDYKIWQRTTQTAPTSEVQPAFILDSDGYQGIVGMNNTEARWTLGQAAKGRRQVAGNIGNYQLRSATDGAPSDTGTWKNVGTATDTRNTTALENYERHRSSIYTSTRISNYLGGEPYLGFVSEGFQIYTGDFTGDFSNYNRPFTGEYQAYSSPFVGDFIDTQNFDRLIEADYSHDYISSTDIQYVSTFAGDYTGTFTLYYEGDFVGQYATDSTRNDFTDFTRTRFVNYEQTYSNYVSPFVRDFTGDFSNYNRPFTGEFANYNRPFTGDFTNFSSPSVRNYERTSVEHFVGTFTADYENTFTGNFHAYTAPSVTDYQTDYTNEYLRTQSIGYQTNYERDKLEYYQNYISPYMNSVSTTFTLDGSPFVFDREVNSTSTSTGAYIGTFLGDFTGNFLNFSDPSTRNYLAEFAADYSRDFIEGPGEIGYVDEYAGHNVNSFAANFNRLVNFNTVYTGFVNSTSVSTANSTSTSTRIYTRNSTANSTSTSTANSTSTSTANSTRPYARTSTRPYARTSTSTSTLNSTSTSTRIYTRNSTRNSTRPYARHSTRTSTRDVNYVNYNKRYTAGPHDGYSGTFSYYQMPFGQASGNTPPQAAWIIQQQIYGGNSTTTKVYLDGTLIKDVDYWFGRATPSSSWNTAYNIANYYATSSGSKYIQGPQVSGSHGYFSFYCMLDTTPNYTGPTYGGYYTKRLYYTGDFTGNFTGDFTGNFTGNFQREYTGDFLRDYTGDFTGNFTGDFTGNFTGDFLRDYTGDFLRDYTGDFQRDYTGDFLRDYTGDFLRDYTGDFQKDTQKSLDYAGQVNYVQWFTAIEYIKEYLKERTVKYGKDYSQDYMRDSTRNSTLNYHSYVSPDMESYTGDFTNYTLLYFTANYVGQPKVHYVSNFAGNYLGNFTPLSGEDEYIGFLTDYSAYTLPSTADYQTDYTNEYVGTFSRDRGPLYFETNYSGFVTPYQREYAGNYAKDYEAEFTRGSVRNFQRGSVRTFERTSTRGRVSSYNTDYTTGYEGNYASTFIGNFTDFVEAIYESTSTRKYETTVTENYSNFANPYVTNYSGDYQALFTGEYTEVFANEFIKNFERQSVETYIRGRVSTFTRNSTFDFEKQYQGDFVGDFLTAYEREFSNYVSPFVGDYSGLTIQNASETIQTFTLYVRES